MTDFTSQKVVAMTTFTKEQFDSRETIFHSGEPGACAYVIEEGCVEVLRGEDDDQRRIAVLAQGAMFGEVALLDHQPRTATVRTLVPTRLIRIDRNHVEELLLRSDPVIQFLLKQLLVRFRNANGVAVEQDADNERIPDRRHSELPVGDLHATALRTLTLAQDLSNAIEHNQLELFYQPLIACSSQRLIGLSYGRIANMMVRIRPL